MNEHFRPVGTRTDIRVLAQGYYCGSCGVSGLSMMGHTYTECTPNPELVHMLTIVNSPTWEKDRDRLSEQICLAYRNGRRCGELLFPNGHCRNLYTHDAHPNLVDELLA